MPQRGTASIWQATTSVHWCRNTFPFFKSRSNESDLVNLGRRFAGNSTRC